MAVSAVDELIRYVDHYNMRHQMASISMDELVKLMETEPNNMVILDQRTSTERDGDWIGGHIKGAINTPSTRFKQDLPNIYETHKDKTYIIIHCMYSQIRGPKSTSLYLEYVLGNQVSFTQYVYLLEGGFNHFLNECIDRKEMHWIEDYDGSQWEFINDSYRYRHICEHQHVWDKVNVLPPNPPPKITKFEWGIIDVHFNGMDVTFKDCVLTPNGAKEWNWKLDGTRHNPGITVEAIRSNELLDHDVEIVILTKGVRGRLQTKTETIQYLQKAKDEGMIQDYVIQQSREAFETYTQLIENGRKVSALVHSTC